ncbi:MAG: cell division protein FtsL [Spirochaetaceae bacterium]|nr:MAG: cell division protein FtsL [Spirochaetaceae bacterium]
MNRLVVLAIALSIPLLLLLNSWQAYRYEALTRETVRLERHQHDVIEEQKRAIATLSVLRSPSRVRDIARNQLDLKRVDIGRIYTIHLESGR